MFDINTEKEQMCVFCKVGKNEVTVEKDGKEIIYKKDVAIENYQIFLRKLKDQPNVKKHFKDVTDNVIKVV